MSEHSAGIVEWFNAMFLHTRKAPQESRRQVNVSAENT
jgi:hypothetical protein